MANKTRLARRFVASYFNVGDIILFGKYKNKKGVITEIGKDPKGNPTITIEPIPKGRKQTKTMGLFKIWKAPKDVINQAEQIMKDEGKDKKAASRVAARFVKAEGIPLGKTYERGDLRIHRYMGSFRVTDVTNAGKRGKKVRQMSIGLSLTKDHDPWYDNMAKMLPHMDSYDEVKRTIKDLQQQFPNEIWLEEQELRGIDVNPGGTTPIELTTNEGLKIYADPLSFRVTRTVEFENKDKTNRFKQDTTYYSVARKDAGPFYNWVKANLSEANKLDIEKFRKLCDDLKIRYDFH